MKKQNNTAAVARTPTREVEDNGTVQIGAISPSFPPARAAPVEVKDHGKARIGAISPSFPPPAMSR